MTLESVRQRSEKDARAHGFYLNPDADFLEDLLEGLKHNEKRYGYPSCPCRLASGRFELDRDIICPCDYRDADVEEFGQCYCALYVDRDVFNRKKKMAPIPERRPIEKQTEAHRSVARTPREELTGKDIEKPTKAAREDLQPRMRMLYCRQCGYVCFREEPPLICPICRAKQEMFADVRIATNFHG